MDFDRTRKIVTKVLFKNSPLIFHLVFGLEVLRGTEQGKKRSQAKRDAKTRDDLTISGF
jgi:hypothetical protein